MVLYSGRLIYWGGEGGRGVIFGMLIFGDIFCGGLYTEGVLTGFYSIFTEFNF